MSSDFYNKKKNQPTFFQYFLEFSLEYNLMYLSVNHTMTYSHPWKVILRSCLQLHMFPRVGLLSSILWFTQDEKHQLFFAVIQSNLCIMITWGTKFLQSLQTGGHYKEDLCTMAKAVNSDIWLLYKGSIIFYLITHDTDKNKSACIFVRNKKML